MYVCLYICTYERFLYDCKLKHTVYAVFMIYYIVVPIPLVQIIIPDSYKISGNDNFGQSGNSTLWNVTIGDPLTLDCTITAVRNISSSVDIIWTTGGRVIRRVDNITADIEIDHAIYSDSLEISSLSAIDNGREYQCTVVINANQPVNSSDQITLIFPGKCNISMWQHSLISYILFFDTISTHTQLSYNCVY